MVRVALTVTEIGERLADLPLERPEIATRVHADPIDLVGLTQAGPVLAFEIARSGQLLFERRPGAFREFHPSASSGPTGPSRGPGTSTGTAAPTFCGGTPPASSTPGC